MALVSTLVPSPGNPGEGERRRVWMSKLSIGIVGLGFGLRYMRDLMRSDEGQRLLDVRAVCDLSADRLIEATNTFGPGCRKFQSIEPMLAMPELQAVALFTSPAGRAQLILKIIRAGKHVMTTKPFELDPLHAMRVLEEAAKLGRVVHLNSPSPHLRPDLRQIREWQVEHRLGRPVAAQFQTWCSYHEPADGSWYDDPQRCPAAPIFRLGIYAINDILEFLAGPQEVHVMHSRLCTGRPTPDHAQLSIRFRGGELASVFASFCIDSGLAYPDRLTLAFERGCVHRFARSTLQEPATNLQLQTRDADGRPILLEKVFEGPQCTGHWSYQWATFCRA